MKNLFKIIVIGILSAFVATGCQKAPTQEVTDAQAKVEAVTTADTQTYAADELAQLQADMNVALEEIKVQDEKWFGNFDNAKVMLSDLGASAENIATIAAQRKEEAKTAAVNAQIEALTAIESAKALVDQAPTGKETKADIEMFKMDISGLEESLAGLQSSIDTEKYSEALDSANIIKERASSISNEITLALEKVKSKKK
ncbi:MAG: hypothetical protein JW944_05725 [Deltaproteobacteria bacterium]|nr:hypothetical protein [Deltaproteobacteria bacterium]